MKIAIKHLKESKKIFEGKQKYLKESKKKYLKENNKKYLKESKRYLKEYWRKAKILEGK